MADITRRELIGGAIAVGVAVSFDGVSRAFAADAATQPAANYGKSQAKWLDTLPGVEGATVGTTWGTPWPRGQVKKADPLRVENDSGVAIPAQTWPIAYWPDGSVKWSAVAVGPQQAGVTGFLVKPGAAAGDAQPIVKASDGETIEIDTGVIQCTIRPGIHFIESVRRNGRTDSDQRTPCCASAECTRRRVGRSGRHS